VLPRYAFKLFGEQYRAGAADPMPLKHPVTLPVQRGRLRPPRRALPLNRQHTVLYIKTAKYPDFAVS
jgi:hypothetical protein